MKGGGVKEPLIFTTRLFKFLKKEGSKIKYCRHHIWQLPKSTKHLGAMDAAGATVSEADDVATNLLPSDIGGGGGGGEASPTF